jgi:hypothetical protein
MYFFQGLRPNRTISAPPTAILPAGVSYWLSCCCLCLVLAGCLTTHPPQPGSPGFGPTGGSTQGAPALTTAQTEAAADSTVLPLNKFTVQVGAYQSRQSADRTAGLAGDRFTRNIYTFYDAEGNFFKVFIGVFDSKEEARRFRDRMAQQYPQDYRDAWVAELKK